MKHVLITGASGGLGLYLSEYLLKNNYYVIMLYNNNKDKVEELHNRYENSLIYQLDLTDDNKIDKFINYLNINNININILINNAAIDNTSSIEDKTKDTFIDVFTINTYAPFKLMRDLKYDACVNISSDNTIDKYDEVTTEYDVSKVGLNMLSNIFKNKYPNRIYNTIAFGWLDTPMNKLLTDDVKEYIEFIPLDKAVKQIESLFDKQIDNIVIVRK